MIPQVISRRLCLRLVFPDSMHESTGQGLSPAQHDPNATAASSPDAPSTGLPCAPHRKQVVTSAGARVSMPAPLQTQEFHNRLLRSPDCHAVSITAESSSGSSSVLVPVALQFGRVAATVVSSMGYDIVDDEVPVAAQGTSVEPAQLAPDVSPGGEGPSISPQLASALFSQAAAAQVNSMGYDEEVAAIFQVGGSGGQSCAPKGVPSEGASMAGGVGLADATAVVAPE